METPLQTTRLAELLDNLSPGTIAAIINDLNEFCGRDELAEELRAHLERCVGQEDARLFLQEASGGPVDVTSP